MTSKEKAYALLEKAGVKYKQFKHEPLFKCEDTSKVNFDCEFAEMKNLFLRNKDKSMYYLVSMSFHKRADLKALQAELGETKLSFASAEDMLEKLGVTPGSVSLLNAACVETSNLHIVLDEDIFSSELIGFHPNDNTETVVFNSTAIKDILKHVIPQSVVVCMS